MKWCLMERYVLTFPVPIVDPSVVDPILYPGVFRGQ